MTSKTILYIDEYVKKKPRPFWFATVDQMDEIHVFDTKAKAVEYGKHLRELCDASPSYNFSVSVSYLISPKLKMKADLILFFSSRKVSYEGDRLK